MARRLEEQARDFRRALSALVKRYQFRDRNETVAFGLSVTQAYALGVLDEHGALTMGGLAEELSLTVSTLTRAVDPLVERGLVRRSEDPDDRRVRRVALTVPGRRVWRRLERGLLASESAVLRALAPAEREAMIRALRLLARATDDWRAHTKR